MQTGICASVEGKLCGLHAHGFVYVNGPQRLSRTETLISKNVNRHPFSGWQG